jgi:hypothetical protein
MTEQQFRSLDLVKSDVGEGLGAEQGCACHACDCLLAELTLMRRRVRTLNADLSRERAARDSSGTSPPYAAGFRAEARLRIHGGSGAGVADAEFRLPGA